MKGQFINDDCMNYLDRYPDNHFDLAIVDPPYGIGDFNQSKSKHKKIDWNNEIPTIDYFKELQRVSQNQIIWGANYYGKYIDSTGRIIHDKCDGRNQLKELSDCDIASHSFGVNIKMFRFTWQGNVQGNSINWNNTGHNGRVHPCQKPLELYKWLLQNYAKEGDLILDTHVGSASSLIACEDMGFNYVGFEIDKDYYDAAMKRLNNHIAQLEIF